MSSLIYSIDGRVPFDVEEVVRLRSLTALGFPLDSAWRGSCMDIDLTTKPRLSNLPARPVIQERKGGAASTRSTEAFVGLVVPREPARGYQYGVSQKFLV